MSARHVGVCYAVCVYDEPYLETCCRAALHRVMLAGAAGRPGTEKDAPCLRRLAAMGLVAVADGRWHATARGRSRHAREVLRNPGLPQPLG